MLYSSIATATVTATILFFALSNVNVDAYLLTPRTRMKMVKVKSQMSTPPQRQSTTTTKLSRNSSPPFSFCLSSTSSSSSSSVTESSVDTTSPDTSLETSRTTPPAAESIPPSPGSHEELLYALGVNLARQLGDVRPLVASGHELAQLARGLVDTVVGRYDEKQQVDLLQRRGGELNQLITTRANAIRERLEAAGREMLDEMANTPGAQVLPTGVVLHVLEHGPEGPGQGKRPTLASTVKIHYHGTLADGTVFDSTMGTFDESQSTLSSSSSSQPSPPVQFPLAAVIPGWRDGVLKMHEGETAMLGIPPEQGYGQKGTPDGRIPGGSTLFFKIQLVEIMSAAIGGRPELLGADGRKMATKKVGSSGGGLLGADGRPL